MSDRHKISELEDLHCWLNKNEFFCMLNYSPFSKSWFCDVKNKFGEYINDQSYTGWDVIDVLLRLWQDVKSREVIGRQGVV